MNVLDEAEQDAVYFRGLAADPASGSPFACKPIKLGDRVCNGLDFSGSEAGRVHRQGEETERLIRLLLPHLTGDPDSLALLKFAVEWTFNDLQVFWQEDIEAEFEDRRKRADFDRIFAGRGPLKKGE